MGRAGRYSLAVMVWIATYAGWSTVLGFVVAAVTGRQLEAGEAVGPQVSVGLSALFSVLVPLVPTLVALWFNDWARDGFLTREERRRAMAAVRTDAVPPVAGSEPAAEPAAEPATAPATAPATVPALAAVTVPPPAVPVLAVPPPPWEVPARPDPAAPAYDEFPVAPALREPGYSREAR